MSWQVVKTSSSSGNVSLCISVVRRSVLKGKLDGKKMLRDRRDLKMSDVKRVQMMEVEQG